MDLSTITNKNGDTFELSNEEMDNILSAEFIIQTPFKDSEGTPDEYLKQVTDKIGEPKFPSVGKEGIILGWLLFNGVRKFGVEYLKEILKEDDAVDSIIYMLVAQSEALTDQASKDTDEIVTSNSEIN